MDVTILFCFGIWCYIFTIAQGALIYSNTWAVHIEGGLREARSVAEQTGFTCEDEIMPDYYHFRHHNVEKRSLDANVHHHSNLKGHPKVLWVAQQEIKTRKKRDLMNFNDVMYRQQWYLRGRAANRRSSRMDMNVQSAWSKGYSGRGVVVTVLDDGIERLHADLEQNYDEEASYDINGKDRDPTPRYDFYNDNRHGTRCAGEIAAVANNSVCGVGVAYNAGIGGIRMLDGDVTDSVEAMSLSYRRDHIDIYSASWGPDDDGKTVDGPATLARKAFRDGVSQGRNGKGSIFIWASGNGGSHYDNCNCDGYTNSIYTLSVSSATERGDVPWYSEACSSTLVSTYSSGDNDEKQIITTDLKGRCTDLHTGTSASAPLAAGIVALALQANPSLTWRDVQYISVLGASSDGLDADDWTTNGAGLKVSHHFGFGLMNAGRMVDLAKNWTTMPEQHICEVASSQRNILIMPKQTKTLSMTTAGCRGSPDKEVSYVEHVQAKVTLSSSWRGDLQIWLVSPSGTRSNLLTSRAYDDSGTGFNEWGFLTTHCWGEESAGNWTLEISNGYRAGKRAKLNSWSLVLYGTSTDPRKAKAVPTTTTTTTTTTPSISSSTSVKTEGTRPNTGTLSMEPIILKMETTTKKPTTSMSTSTTEGPVTVKGDNHLPTVHSSTDLVDLYKNWNSKASTSTPSNIVNKDPNAGVSCPLDMYYMRDLCVDECPIGYYSHRLPKLNLVCEACHHSCVQCHGGRNDSCTKCFFGSKLHGGQCISIAKEIYPKTGASKPQGLSSAGIKTMVYGGISTVVILLVVLVSLLGYYKYHQRRTSKRHKGANSVNTGTNNKPSLATYQPVNPAEIMTGSKHSSQQELMDSGSELSSLDKNSGIPPPEYIYASQPLFGERV